MYRSTCRLRNEKGPGQGVRLEVYNFGEVSVRCIRLNLRSYLLVRVGCIC